MEKVVLLVVLSLIYLSGAAGSLEKDAKASHFVFVHGAMHGGWCWYEIRSRLEKAGHKVSCLDLKASGIELSDPNTIFKFAEYDEPLIKFMSSLPEEEKVVLVGHSLGGLSVTHSIQEFGRKIHVAIYITALMLPITVPMDNKTRDFIYGQGTHKPPTSAIIKKEFQREIMYQLSPVKDSTLASMLLRPVPTRAVGNANFSVRGDMDKVKRVFVKTTKDQTLKPEFQDQIIQMWPPSMVLEIDTDHSPFFSAPSKLVHLIFQAMAHE